MKRMTLFKLWSSLAVGLSLVGLATAAEAPAPAPAAKPDAATIACKMVAVRTPMTRKAPVLDGRLDLESGEWADAACVPGMIRAGGDGLLMPHPSRCYLTWDADNLYVGLRTAVPPGTTLKRGATRASDLNADDRYEIVLDPLGRDQPAYAFFHVIFNARGTRWEAIRSEVMPVEEWNAAWKGRFTMARNFAFGRNAMESEEWKGGWTIRSAYQPGMATFDAEAAIPVKSLLVKDTNADGQAWRILVARSFEGLLRDLTVGPAPASMNGGGAFIRPQASGCALVLDSAAPVVQFLDDDAMRDGRFGLRLRIANPGAKPLACRLEAVARVDKTGTLAVTEDWAGLPDPAAREERAVTLAPGREEEWVVPARDLPPLPADAPKARHVFAVRVGAADGGTLYFQRQCPIGRARLQDRPLELSFDAPARTLVASWELRDHPLRERVAGLRLEAWEPGADPAKPPAAAVTSREKSMAVVRAACPLPDMRFGAYRTRLTLLDGEGKDLESTTAECAWRPDRQPRTRTLPASVGGKGGVPLVKVAFETVLAADGSTRATAYHKSNKIVTAGDKVFVGWQDVFLRSWVSTWDGRAGRWEPDTLLGEGQDNHAGPALAMDGKGRLHALYGPHAAQPFQYRVSLRPHDASEWSEVERFDEPFDPTYPTILFDGQDTMYIAFRGRPEAPREPLPWVPQFHLRSYLQHKAAGGSWTEPREMAIIAPRDLRGFPGSSGAPYAQYNENLAIGADGTLHYAFYLYGDHPERETYQGVGYLRSRDGGRTWQALDGTKLDLPVLRDSPAVFLRPPVDAAGKQDPAWKVNIGNVALDPEGNPWVYTFGTLWCGEGGTWRAIDLKPTLQRDFPGKIADSGNTLGNVVFDKDGTLYVSCEIEDPPGGWGKPGTQVVLLVSGDRGKTFGTLPISGVDSKVACWFSNLERPTGPRLLDGPPNLVYMRGEPGKIFVGGPASEVVFVRLVK